MCRRRTKLINKDLKMWTACKKNCLDVFQMKSTWFLNFSDILKLKHGSLSI